MIYEKEVINMTDEELKQLIAENAKGMKDLREAQLQTDAQLAKTDAKLVKIGDQIIATNAKLQNS